MFKRTRWMVVGYAAGLGSSAYAAYRARKVVQRYSPPAVVDRAVDSASNAAARVRDALVEGRAAMTERETELRLKHPR